MAIYTVFESVNMGSTHFAERIFDAVCENNVENGTFGYLDGLADGYSHIYKFVPGFKAGKKVVVVDHPAWNPDTCRITNQRRDQFINEAGVPFRVRVVKVNDEFGISAEGFTAETREAADADKYLSIDASGKLAVADAASEDAVMNAKIERKRMTGAAIHTAIRDYGRTCVFHEDKVESLA